jgi:hypothetical protein
MRDVTDSHAIIPMRVKNVMHVKLSCVPPVFMYVKNVLSFVVMHVENGMHVLRVITAKMPSLSCVL